MTKEVAQMHNMDVFQPVAWELLNNKERRKALALLMFMKEKQEELVKARMCADGWKQRGDWTKEDMTLATMSMKAVFITAVIEAHKEQDATYFDTPGAFLHANADKDIIMIL